jgi:PAS domain S-box-containing protein
MPTKPTPSAKTAELRGRTTAELRAVGDKHEPGSMMAELYRNAEAQLRKQKKNQKSKAARIVKTEADSQRLVHELQVHQVELEMQNAELQEGRNRMEVLLEKFTDLYDFSPVGYFTVAAAGTIRQVNLTGAHLVGVERSRLVGLSFGTLVSAAQRPAFNSFLKLVSADQTSQSIDVELLNQGQPLRVIRIRAQRSPAGEECRVVVVDITELNREIDKVRVSEIRYRRLFEASHDGVLLLDPGTRKITDANPFMTKLLGYPCDQLIGKELFEIGLLKDEVASQEMFQELKRKREVRYEDLPLESQGGRHQEVEVVANLYQENGHAVIQCNIRDITQRKHIEQELSEKARLLDLSHDAIIVRDIKGCIRYWNHGAEELYGWTREEAFGKLSHVLLQTEFPIPLKEMTAELHRSDRWIGELVHTSRAGRRITVLARKTLDRDRYGHPVAVLENITDITKRKLAEMASNRLAAIVEFSSDAMVGKDLNGIITSWNKGAETIFGYAAREMVGTSIMRLIPTDRRHEEKQILAKIKRGKSLKHFETLRKTKNGRLIAVSVTVSPIRDAAGKIIGASKVARDITERKQAEEEQRRLEVMAASNRKLHEEIMRRQAVEASLKKSELHQRDLLAQSRLMQEQLRQLSRQVLHAQEEERRRISRELHDVIAQTLTGINLRLATLKKEAGGNPKDFDRNLTRTQLLVEKSVNIVHEFARELRPAVLDDLGLIPALHSFTKNFTAQTGIHVHLTAFAEVEKLETSQRTVLFRVAQEALTNVNRHAQASRVEVSIQKMSDGICMKIKDDGKSFGVERALQASTGKRLGLLGMRERLEMIGGTFGVESAPGKGTTIIAQIPLGKARVWGGSRSRR